MIIQIFKTYSEVIRDIVVILGVVVGGGWTLFVFIEMHEMDKSKLELVKIKQEIVQRPLVSGSMATKIHYLEKDKHWIVEVALNLKNTGQTDAHLDLNESPILWAKMDFEQSMLNEYLDIKRGHLTSIPAKTSPESKVDVTGVTLLAGQEKTKKFAIKVDAPGTYQLQFKASPGESIIKARLSAGSSTHDVHKVNIREIVIIEDVSHHVQPGAPAAYGAA